MSKPSAGVPNQTDIVTLNRAATVARLLSGLAHEVNNALQVIGGTTELLQFTPDLPEPVANGLQRIVTQNARAATVIAEVMTFARQNVDVRGRVNLREVAIHAIGLRSFAARRSRIAMSVDAPADGRFLVHGSTSRLMLVVLNLVINAEQALAGRDDGRIRVELSGSDREVVLRVSDNGPGIDPVIAGEIFEAFVTTRPREEASGLGLTVARLVADQHGGTLDLTDCGPGACFELRLPASGQ